MARPKKDIISSQTIERYMTDAMTEYGLEVVENRAIPRVEDGLKPVQRAIVWGSHEMKAFKFIKSARIVGKVLGDYHPHGDGSVYDALVNLVNAPYQVMEGHGNFGGIMSPAAASRYTEAKLSDFVRKLATDTPDLSVVPTNPNYDDRKTIPKFLPTRVPLLLLNGSSGIAVAISTRIPSHNLHNVTKAIISYLKTGKEENLIKYVAHPDSEHCEILSTKKDIVDLYKNGEGTVEYQCRFHQENKRGFKQAVITGYVPEFGLSNFLTKCARLQDEDIIEFVRDETSSTNGDRIVVAYKDQALFDKKVLPLMRKKLSYKFNVLVPSGDAVKVQKLTLKDVVDYWLDARRKTIADTLNAQINALNAKLSREQAKELAVSKIDLVVRALKSKKPFVDELQRLVGLTQEQAQVVAAMRIDALRKYTKDEILAKINDINASIAGLQEKLKDIDKEIIDQLYDIIHWAKQKDPTLLDVKTQVSWQ